MRKTRSDVINHSLKEAVVAWWISETRASPSARRLCASGSLQEFTRRCIHSTCWSLRFDFFEFTQ
jgi:hypothetical protein